MDESLYSLFKSQSTAASIYYVKDKQGEEEQAECLMPNQSFEISTGVLSMSLVLKGPVKLLENDQIVIRSKDFKADILARLKSLS